MLLDSDSSLKVAHDIIHDAAEFFHKWPLLILSPEETPGDEDVANGYVDMEYADGSLLRVPCAWSILGFDDTRICETLTFKNGAEKTIWVPGEHDTASGTLAGVYSDGPITAGMLELKSIIARRNDGAYPVIIIRPLISKLNGQTLNGTNCRIHQLNAPGEFSLQNCTFVNLNIPDGNVSLSMCEATEIDGGELESRSEQIIAAEKFNAWMPSSTSRTTDAKYSALIPFDALTAEGLPINGYDRMLSDNPFYPDWIYASEYVHPYEPGFAWVPSSTRPRDAYWQDEDGLFWHKVTVSIRESMRDLPYYVWPPRTSPDMSNSQSTTPPMKAMVDGMVVTVRSLANRPVQICLTSKYEYKSDTEWQWYAIAARKLPPHGICQFITKRVFQWSGNKIVGVEYQFLPIGELDD